MLIIVILGAFTIVADSSASEVLRCCPEGSLTRRNRTFNPYCFDPVAKTKVEEPLPLQCAFVSVVHESVNFSVNEYGQLALFDAETHYPPIAAGKFCLGTAKRPGRNETAAVAAACVEPPAPRLVAGEVEGYCFLLSAALLILTSGVYLCLPELRDLEGWSVINLCGSMGTGFLIFGIMKTMAYTDMTWCAVRGFSAYFFMVAAFLWMNALAVQVLNSFKQTIPRQFMSREVGVYAAYAWGVSALLTAAMAAVNYIEGPHRKPSIGLNHCWFNNELDPSQQWIYLYSVMLIVIVINFCIFIYISVCLWHHNFSSSTITALRYRFYLMLRLFFLMGLPWIFEMISSLFPNQLVLDVLAFLNTFVGILFFAFLVVLRRRVVKALQRRGWLCCCSSRVERHLARADDEEAQDVAVTVVMPLESPANGTAIH